MVLLVLKKFAKLYSELENRHHHDLYAFKSHISKFIAQLALDLKPGSSEILSLSWIARCFCILPMINNAFSKLLVDINYPMSKWEIDSIEGYFNYTLILLEILNSMSSSFSNLGRSRVSLAHGLSLMESSPSLDTEHIKEIQVTECFRTEFGKELYTEIGKAKVFSGKEGVIHEAIKEMKSFGLWVCGVLFSGLCSDVMPLPHMELRKIGGIAKYVGNSAGKERCLSRERLVEKMTMFNEVKLLNVAVAELVAASDEMKHDAAMEVKTKLHEFERVLDDINKKVDDLFANVMAQRSELIDCFRLKEQHQKSIV